MLPLRTDFMQGGAKKFQAKFRGGSSQFVNLSAPTVASAQHLGGVAVQTPMQVPDHYPRAYFSEAGNNAGWVGE